MNIKLKSGNRISIFLNEETNLFVVDLIDKNDIDGNELIRMEIDEKNLLSATHKTYLRNSLIYDRCRN